MLKSSYPYYLGGQACAPNQDLIVTDKYTGEVATRVAVADAAAIDAGIQAAVDSFEEMRRMPPYARQAILQHCMNRFEERFDELASPVLPRRRVCAAHPFGVRSSLTGATSHGLPHALRRRLGTCKLTTCLG